MGDNLLEGPECTWFFFLAQPGAKTDSSRSSYPADSGVEGDEGMLGLSLWEGSMEKTEEEN